MEEKKYEISERLLQAVINYLGTKPFQEVAQLIKAIQSEAAGTKTPAVPEEAKPEEKPEEEK